MDRLTQTSDKGGVAFTFDLDITCRPSEAQKILRLAEKLKEYEDAEEQGLLFRLPVAEGSTVYEVKDYLDCEYDYHCPLGYAEGKNNCENGFCCDHEYKKYFVSETKFNPKFNLIMLDKIGKTVFLTREEAEKALAEMHGK